MTMRRGKCTTDDAFAPRGDDSPGTAPVVGSARALGIKFATRNADGSELGRDRRER